MKISNPYVKGMAVKVPPETINSEMSQAGSKAKARYPDTPISNQPSGGGSTGGSFKRAMTPGTSPAGS